METKNDDGTLKKTGDGIATNQNKFFFDIIKWGSSPSSLILLFYINLYLTHGVIFYAVFISEKTVAIKKA